ncbi:MAG TPA: PhzF family phenazine biosynthesis protein [Novosphingobium sp.]|nr:PhzF family phenazine biosynthesis protein [Novosphingobium sp.]
MTELSAGLIDVFAEKPLSGNPLAVVEGADALSEADMRRIAGEFNQAETTFLLKSDRADRRLRSFTAAGAEVTGAGHNALGAWLWLAEHGALGPLATPQTFHQEIGDEVLPLVLARVAGRIQGRMRQAPPRLLPPLDDITPLARALGLLPGDILATPAPRPVGFHLLVRLRDAAAIDRARPANEPLHDILRAAGAEGCYIYAHDLAASQKAYARFFNPAVGLWEDAATGTAAGPLAAYLSSAGLLQAGTLAVEQGVKMGRRSIINIKVTPDPEISGAGIVVFRGVLRVA